jgi:hypothetical protein
MAEQPPKNHSHTTDVSCPNLSLPKREMQFQGETDHHDQLGSMPFFTPSAQELCLDRAHICS